MDLIVAECCGHKYMGFQKGLSRSKEMGFGCSFQFWMALNQIARKQDSVLKKPYYFSYLIWLCQASGKQATWDLGLAQAWQFLWFPSSETLKFQILQMIVPVSRVGKCVLNNNCKSHKAARGRSSAVLKHVKHISDQTAFCRGLLSDLPAKVLDTT